MTSRHFVGVFAMIAVALLLAGSLGDAQAASKRGARYNSNASRQAAAAAKARKAQQIKSIQQQLSVARQILANAESQTAMSQGEVNQALAKLSGIRTEIESAEDDVEQAVKTLHAIEAEILAEQPPDSEFATALAAETQAKDDVHRAIHRVLGLPEHPGQSVDAALLNDVAEISAAQRQALDSDVNYLVAQQDLKDAAARVEKLRRQLFQANADWIAAERDLSEAHTRAREGTEQAKTAGLSSLDDRQDLSRAQNVAAAARALVAQGEARLRQLGAKPAASSGSGGSVGSRSTK